MTGLLRSPRWPRMRVSARRRPAPSSARQPMIAWRGLRADDHRGSLPVRFVRAGSPLVFTGRAPRIARAAGRVSRLGDGHEVGPAMGVRSAAISETIEMLRPELATGGRPAREAAVGNGKARTRWLLASARLRHRDASRVARGRSAAGSAGAGAASACEVDTDLVVEALPVAAVDTAAAGARGVTNPVGGPGIPRGG